MRNKSFFLSLEGYILMTKKSTRNLEVSFWLNERYPFRRTE